VAKLTISVADCLDAEEVKTLRYILDLVVTCMDNRIDIDIKEDVADEIFARADMYPIIRNVRNKCQVLENFIENKENESGNDVE
jgi:hypothetical protein